MNVPWAQLGLIAALGALGGLVQCITRGFRWPYRDESGQMWFLGSIGTIVVGAIAAPVVWGFYGTFASFDMCDAAKTGGPQLPGLQLAFSVLVGFGGGEVLKLEAQKRLFGQEKEEFKGATANLAKLLQEIMIDQEEVSYDTQRGEREDDGTS